MGQWIDTMVNWDGYNLPCTEVNKDVLLEELKITIELGYEGSQSFVNNRSKGRKGLQVQVQWEESGRMRSQEKEGLLDSDGKVEITLPGHVKECTVVFPSITEDEVIYIPDDSKGAREPWPGWKKCPVELGETPEHLARKYGLRGWEKIFFAPGNEGMRKAAKGTDDREKRLDNFRFDKGKICLSLPCSSAQKANGNQIKVISGETCKFKIFEREWPPILFDAHMHIMSGNGTPYPAWRQLLIDSIHVAPGKKSKATRKGVWKVAIDVMAFFGVSALKFAQLASRSTGEIGKATIAHSNDLKNILGKFSVTEALSGQSSLLCSSIVLPMDMDYCHVDGYIGIPVYTWEIVMLEDGNEKVGWCYKKLSLNDNPEPTRRTRKGKPLSDSQPEYADPFRRETIWLEDEKDLNEELNPTREELLDALGHEFDDLVTATDTEELKKLQTATDTEELKKPQTATDTEELKKLQKELKGALEQHRVRFELGQDAEICAFYDVAKAKLQAAHPESEDVFSLETEELYAALKKQEPKRASYREIPGSP